MARLPASVSPLLGRHTGTMCGCWGGPAPRPAPFPAPRSSRTSARSLSLVRLSNPGCKTTSRIAASWCGSGSPALSMLSSPSRTCSRLVSAPCKLEPVHTQGGRGVGGCYQDTVGRRHHPGRRHQHRPALVLPAPVVHELALLVPHQRGLPRPLREAGRRPAHDAAAPEAGPRAAGVPGGATPTLAAVAGEGGGAVAAGGALEAGQVGVTCTRGSGHTHAGYRLQCRGLP